MAPPTSETCPDQPWRTTIEDRWKIWMWKNVEFNCQKLGLAATLIDEHRVHPLVALAELGIDTATVSAEWTDYLKRCGPVPIVGTTGTTTVGTITPQEKAPESVNGDDDDGGEQQDMPDVWEPMSPASREASSKSHVFGETPDPANVTTLASAHRRSSFIPPPATAGSATSSSVTMGGGGSMMRAESAPPSMVTGGGGIGISAEDHFRFRKADWTLRMMMAASFMDPTPVPRRIDERTRFPAWSDFLRDYASQLKPLVIRGGARAPDWPGTKWTFEYLLNRIGTSQVQVQTGRAKDRDFELNSVQHRTMVPFHEFLDRLRNGPTNDVYMTANNSAVNRQATRPLLQELGRMGSARRRGGQPDTDACYLKPGSLPDYGFLWVGYAGGFTPLHHDCDHIIHVQVTGRKRWRMAPVHATPALANFTHVFSRISDPWLPFDAATHPAEARNVPWMDFDLDAGDVLYIPEGVWHAVKQVPDAQGGRENVSVSTSVWRDGMVHVGGCP